MSERTEIETLLPWYATGKLSPCEHEKVDLYLEAHPDMAMQLELIEQERFETTMINEAIATPSTTGVDRLMEQLDEEFGSDKSAAQSSWLKSLWSDMTSALQIPVVQFAGIAAAFLIIIQAVSLGVIINNNPQSTQYTTASGPGTKAGNGIVMLVSFNKSATGGAISKFLQESNGSIVSGPLAGGIYHIKFATNAAKPENVETLANSLEARTDLFDFVSEVE